MRIVLALGAALIASSLIQRYINLVISTGDPRLQNWASGNGLLAPVLGLVVFVLVFGGALDAFRR